MNRPPEISITRLAMYLRRLEEFAREKGAASTINSVELAQLLGINPHQIRKDLSYFGKFGERGVGYRVNELKDTIRTILGLDRSWNMCLCGVGNLGSALCAYQGFKELHLLITAAFDSDPRKIGRSIRGIRVYAVSQMPRILKRLRIDIAIIAVPPQAAQAMADKVVAAGVRGILNFAPVKLNVPRHTRLRNVDFSADLMSLTHFLSVRA